MGLDSYLVNHILFFLLGIVFVAGVQAIDTYRRSPTKENSYPLIQRGGIMLIGIFFVVAMFLVLGPGGWVYQDFMHYQTKMICFPKEWSATIYPLGIGYVNRFVYNNDHVVYIGPENSTTINWSGTILNWSNKTDASISQMPPYSPTTQ